MSFTLKEMYEIADIAYNIGIGWFGIAYLLL